MTQKRHVKFISFNATMLNSSLCRKRKTALIDQRAVAAGKNSRPEFMPEFVPELPMQKYYKKVSKMPIHTGVLFKIESRV